MIPLALNLHHLWWGQPPDLGGIFSKQLPSLKLVRIKVCQMGLNFVLKKLDNFLANYGQNLPPPGMESL